MRESNGDREPAQSIYLSVRYVLYVLKLQTCCMTFIAITPLDFRIMYFFTMSDQYYSTLDRSQSLGGVIRLNFVSTDHCSGVAGERSESGGAGS